MKQIHLRLYTPSDAKAIVDLINTTSMHELGFARAAVDAVGNVRHQRYVPLSSNKVVAVNSQNEIIGYAYLADKENAIVMETGGAVHPEYSGQGIGQTLLAWAAEKARELSKKAPGGVRSVLQVNLFEKEESAIRLFSELGYAKVREWTHMKLTMNEPFPVPSLPDGMAIREMDLDNDWDIVGPAMDDAFTDHWGAILLPAEEETQEEEVDGEDETPSDESFSNAPGYCFIVLDGETVIGGILCNAKLVERNDAGRVGSVFVRKAYRRKHIGSALMQKAFNAFWNNK